MISLPTHDLATILVTTLEAAAVEPAETYYAPEDPENNYVKAWAIHADPVNTDAIDSYALLIVKNSSEEHDMVDDISDLAQVFENF